jgi:glutathione synthase/RimK-type ligase-like ATP-grasp enzyme
MLLIITHKTDFTADFVINKLNTRKIEYKRFNCEDILNYDCSVRFSNSLKYSILNESDFNAVWFRRTQLPNISNLSINEKVYILNETDSLIKNLFSILDTNWISEPYAVYKAENKLMQLKTASEIGFEIPETLITNSKKELKEFYHDNNKQIIIKPLSQTKIESADVPKFIFTNKVTENQIDNLEKFDLTPCIFQREIQKDYEIRVTVVGDKIFSAAVDSQSETETKIDWRKKKLTFTKVELPKSVENLCITIVKRLNLSFGAIDLIKQKNGNYVFLEINPNGQWAWIETQTGLSISEAIINKLTDK